MIPYLLGVVLGLIGQDDQATVILEDGVKHKIVVRQIDDQTLIGSGPKERWPLTQVEKIIFRDPPATSPKMPKLRVSGVDETLVYADSILLDGDALITKTNDQKLIARIPRSLIEAIRIDSSVDTKLWDGMLDKEKNTDGLIISREDRLDRIPGFVKTLNDNQVEFESRGRIAKVDLNKLAGLVFFQPARKTKAAKVKVTDIFQNQYSGQSATLINNELLIKVGVTDSIALPVPMIASLDFGIGRLIDLASLTPEEKYWEPFLRGQVKDKDINELLKIARENKVVYSRNECFGRSLMVDLISRRTADNPAGRLVFRQGVAIKGGSKLVFRIPANAKRFRAQAGIQSSQKNVGSVQLKMTIDGSPQFIKQLAASDKDVAAVDFPCSGDRLTIEVGYGRDNEMGDILVLGNARFQLQ